MFRFIKSLLVSVLWIIIILFAAYCALCIFFPIKYADEIIKYSDKYNIEPGFVCAIINTESRFIPNAESHKGARGLMQLMPATIDWAAEKMETDKISYADIEDPEVNIEIGCWVLSFLSEQFDGNMENVAAAYNAGSGNVEKWLSNTDYSSDGKTLDVIPYSETANYVKRVMSYEKVYKIILRTDLYEIAVD